MNELKKKDLIRARKLCNIFRFIDDLNSVGQPCMILATLCTFCQKHEIWHRPSLDLKK